MFESPFFMHEVFLFENMDYKSAYREAIEFRVPNNIVNVYYLGKKLKFSS